ncbi:hypothetical protein [Paenibacillus fonticola]|uniref:hypothetical protein n=1 Tax=Paenibacillus fonticola TaxID=379896 RepID=UPI000381D43C|nr:hypothetical protein [Paenibacillus fonticola]
MVTVHFARKHAAYVKISHPAFFTVYISTTTLINWEERKQAVLEEHNDLREAEEDNDLVYNEEEIMRIVQEVQNDRS